MSISKIFDSVAQHSNSDDDRTDVEKMRAKYEEGDDEFMTFEKYEVLVDSGRVIAGVLANANLSESERDALKSAGSYLSDEKKKVADETNELFGNLPKFRKAFPSEDREGNGKRFHVLPEEVEEKLNIGRPNGDDEIVLPIKDGEKWTPHSVVGNADESDNEGNSVNTELTDIDGVGETKARTLIECGFETVDAVQGATVSELSEIDGIGDSLAKRLSETEASDETDDSQEGGDDDNDGELTDNEKALAAALLESGDAENFAEAKQMAQNA